VWIEGAICAVALIRRHRRHVRVSVEFLAIGMGADPAAPSDGVDRVA